MVAEDYFEKKERENREEAQRRQDENNGNPKLVVTPMNRKTNIKASSVTGTFKDLNDFLDSEQDHSQFTKYPTQAHKDAIAKFDGVNQRVHQNEQPYMNATEDSDYNFSMTIEGDGWRAVNMPKHYNAHPSGIQCIEITKHMNFCLGNAIKYIWRADEKGNAVQDLEKAVWYLNCEIARRQAYESV